MRVDAQKPEIAITVKQINAVKTVSADNSPSKYVAKAQLYVENIGSGPAKDVKFTIDRDFRVPVQKVFPSQGRKGPRCGYPTALRFCHRGIRLV